VLGRVAGEGHQMSAFTVALDNHPGELARLCEALASGGVNVLLCATTQGSSGFVAFIADDEAAAQAVLDGAGIEYLLRPALTVRMANLHGAGAAAMTMRDNAYMCTDAASSVQSANLRCGDSSLPKVRQSRSGRDPMPLREQSGGSGAGFVGWEVAMGAFPHLHGCAYRRVGACLWRQSDERGD
jgi:hypothetical protein